MRHEALNAILAGWEQGTPDLADRVRRVDDAIVVGLRALGFPRGPVRAVEILSVARPWAGRKQPDCRLLLNGEVMRHTVRMQHQPDDFFRTWVHESLHARGPWAPGAAEQYLHYAGYEEGMVEGLARLLTRNRAAMRPLERAYRYYVVAYRTLASVAGVEVETLWRHLWQSMPGDVRTSFAGAVSTLREQVGIERLSTDQRDRISAVADQLFSLSRQDDNPAERVMMELWRIAFR
jgi:hypothetical protein